MPYLNERFASRLEADLAVHVLSEEGIEASVVASDMGGMVPSMQAVDGVRIDVASEDAERAEVLIRDFVSSASVNPDLSRRERVQSWGIGIALLILLVVFVAYAARNMSATNYPDPPANHELPW